MDSGEHAGSREHEDHFITRELIRTSANDILRRLEGVEQNREIIRLGFLEVVKYFEQFQASRNELMRELDSLRKEIATAIEHSDSRIDKLEKESVKEKDFAPYRWIIVGFSIGAVFVFGPKRGMEIIDAIRKVIGH